MKLLIITDAWNQTNGVVRTLGATIDELEHRGWDVFVIHPGQFKTMRLPGYPEIAVPVSTRGLSKRMCDFDSDYVHIATEGRLGWAARALCLKWGWRFTTAYHTDFPRYLQRHCAIPMRLTVAALRRFHSAAAATMVATQSVEDELRSWGFNNIVRWGRGVDTALFKPKFDAGPDPYILSVGRVSKEKNLEAFCTLAPWDTNGIPLRKIVVGDGPEMNVLRAAYPAVEFVGLQKGAALAEYYRNASAFVFPSRTDTFGLVMIEAMACGTPIAAYPVQGPRDIVKPQSGVLDGDLHYAVARALELPRSSVAAAAKAFTWTAATDQFESGLVPR